MTHDNRKRSFDAKPELTQSNSELVRLYGALYTRDTRALSSAKSQIEPSGGHLNGLVGSIGSKIRGLARGVVSKSVPNASFPVSSGHPDVDDLFPIGDHLHAGYIWNGLPADIRERDRI
jgi:hypothetical protein